ncbi:hypothetical protein [Nocardia sp. NPDC052112]|uniref:hypothetical protein n=1 Tax=Nocardia sp. NPDC052112 TaxID=3155646 RepID=UPI00341EA94D
MGSTSLDDIRELADDFATELRRKNRCHENFRAGRTAANGNADNARTGAVTSPDRR